MISDYFYDNKVELEITSANIVDFITNLTNNNVEIFNIGYVNDLVIRIKIYKKDYKIVKNITNKLSISVKEIQNIRTGLHITALVRRPVLAILIFVLMISGLILPSKVLFITVEGNQTVPTKEILEAAEKCGITFGASRRKVRSEKTKNMLLEKIPKLQWAGINTTGCTAVISVHERVLQSDKNTSPRTVSSIVASNDGIIKSITVTKGTQLCNIGQAVIEGQTLVSGYSDCGIMTKASQADAEIFALTFHEINAVSPAPSYKRDDCIRKITDYSFQIGKKLIKINKDSGILDATCGKIYTEKCLQLPGGFQLPISIIKETVYFYNFSDNKTISLDNSVNWFENSVIDFLKSKMISGEIISSRTKIEETPVAKHLYGKYFCSEMIGQEKFEEYYNEG